MSCREFPFPHEFLGRTATRIINEVRGINRVVYDITSKPRHDRVGVRGITNVALALATSLVARPYRARRTDPQSDPIWYLN